METRRFTILHRGGDPKARLPGYVRYPESVLEVADLLGPQQPQRGEVLGRVLDRSQLDDRAGIDLVRAVGLRWIDFVLQHLDHVPLAHYLKSIRTQMDLLRSRAKRKCALTRFDPAKPGRNQTRPPDLGNEQHRGLGMLLLPTVAARTHLPPTVFTEITKLFQSCFPLLRNGSIFAILFFFSFLSFFFFRVKNYF